MTRNADRVFYFDEGRAESYDEAYPKVQKSQTTLEGLDMIKSGPRMWRNDPDAAKRDELEQGELARREGAMAKSSYGRSFESSLVVLKPMNVS